MNCAARFEKKKFSANDKMCYDCRVNDVVASRGDPRLAPLRFTASFLAAPHKRTSKNALEFYKCAFVIIHLPEHGDLADEHHL